MTRSGFNLAARRTPPLAVEADGRAGWFDGLRAGRLVGWARQPDVEAARVRLSGGGQCLTLVADRYRADVQVAGHGDGYCGFAVELDRFAADTGQVRCVWDDTGHALAGSPWNARPDGHSPAPRLITHGRVQVRIDPLPPGLGSVTGWALDLDNPFARLTLGLDRGGEALASGRACRFNADALSLAGDGFHGFCLPLAEQGLTVSGISLVVRDHGIDLGPVAERGR